DKQFSLYIDNILHRLALQTEAYGKEEHLPAKLFEVYRRQQTELLKLKETYGPIVHPEQLG
ncbi:MAG: hypothetical protein IH612_19385, partial [Desulfofustis sp.]|nr:hypothetical protein [Desulfofustis sp.]